MGDGMPTITGPPYVRDPELVCFICHKKAGPEGHSPRDHIDKELSAEEAENLARECIDDDSSPRAIMLARYLLKLHENMATTAPRSTTTHAGGNR